jgi:hypothetical protein
MTWITLFVAGALISLPTITTDVAVAIKPQLQRRILLGTESDPLPTEELED